MPPRVLTQVSLFGGADVARSAGMSLDLRYRWRLDRRWGRGVHRVPVEAPLEVFAPRAA